MTIIFHLYSSLCCRLDCVKEMFRLCRNPSNDREEISDLTSCYIRLRLRKRRRTRVPIQCAPEKSWHADEDDEVVASVDQMKGLDKTTFAPKFFVPAIFDGVLIVGMTT